MTLLMNQRSESDILFNNGYILKVLAKPGQSVLNGEKKH